MILRRFYVDALAQASYLVGCSATGEALVVDPSRDITPYVEAARAEGLRITHVTETHIHADFVSGTRELCAHTGATPFLSAEGGADWQYRYTAADGATLLRDGDSFKVGNVRIDVLHTPGHTPEHLAFVVTDTAGADRPMGAFTGDFIFAGDVGRPDLLERAAGVANTMDAAAHQLFDALQRFKKQHADYLQLWPGHGAGSACGKALGAVPQTTLGYEKLFNWALAETDPDAFVAAVLEGQPVPPRYFAQMKTVNREGPALCNAAVPPLEDAAALVRVIRDGNAVIDVRPWIDYAAAHAAGTISIPLNKSFLTWAGSLMSYDRDFWIIAQDMTVASRCIAQLSLIGLDRVAGVFDATSIARLDGAPATSAEVGVQDTANAVAKGDAVVLDVRNDDEWETGRLRVNGGTTLIHIPLAQLEARIHEIPPGSALYVHCKAGGRSAIASSVLERHGRKAINVRGGFDAWRAKGLPVEPS